MSSMMSLESSFWNVQSPPMRHRPSGGKINISEDQLHEDRLKNRWSPPLMVVLHYISIVSTQDFPMASTDFDTEA